MRMWGTWGLNVAVLTLLAVGAVAIAGDSSGTPTQNNSKDQWFPWLKGTSDDTSDETSKETLNKPDPEMAREAKATLALAHSKAEVAKAEAARAREQHSLLRRLAVCDQLKLVAVENKDDALLARADQLEQRAQAVYNLRIARIDGTSSGPALGSPGRKEDVGDNAFERRKIEDGPTFVVPAKEAAGHAQAGED
jgi:hypothetical protein